MTKESPLRADHLRGRDYEKLSPDIRALMISATEKASEDRGARRAAARSRAEAARLRNVGKGRARDGIVAWALIILIASLWTFAGVMLYLHQGF